jgi:hypothetical protein
MNQRSGESLDGNTSQRLRSAVSDSDKAKLMGANTARLYGWSPGTA